MARRKPPEEHVNHEAWAIPYGDLITLLLAFFVVMYAMSTVNESKYRVLSDSLSDAFSGPPRSLKPVEVGAPLARRGNTSNYVIDIRPQLALRPLPLRTVPLPTPAPTADDPPIDPNRQLAESVRQALPDMLAQGQINVRARADRVEIDVGSDFLFASGSARGESHADELLRRIARVLARLPYRIRVEGHTDDVPINTWQFPSNWELSASRAAWVVRRLAENGVSPQHLSMQGFGPYQAVSSNDTDTGRRANRRVSIVIDTAAPLALPTSLQAVEAEPVAPVELSQARGPKPARAGP